MLGGYTMGKHSEENEENAGGEQALVAPTATEPLTLMEI